MHIQSCKVQRGKDMVVHDTDVLNAMLDLEPLLSKHLPTPMHGITMKYEKERLVEFGGHIKLGHTWADSLLVRMKFVQQKGETAKSK